MTLPGWYPDPDDPSARRYFDGRSWSAPLKANEPTPAPAAADRKRRTLLLPAMAVGGLVVAAVIVLLVWSPWSSDDSSPKTVRITNAAVARSDVATQFIADLYNADHGDYWRTRPQDVLVDQAGIDCVTGMQDADLRSQFPGLADPGIQEFITIGSRDICAKLTANSQIPGYYTH